MAPIDNIMVLDDMLSTYDHFHPSFHPGRRTSPPASPPHPHLSRIICSIAHTPQDQYSLYKSSGSQDEDDDATPVPSAYPSPPPTSSQPKRSVPLPNINASGSTNSVHFGGILDSPPVMKHEALRCHTPLSPPPTLPTTTLALPPTDHELAYGLDCDSDADGGDVDDDPSIGRGDDDDFAASHLNRGDTVAQLLSPISPEWNSNVIEPEEDSSYDDDVYEDHMDIDGSDASTSNSSFASPPYSPCLRSLDVDIDADTSIYDDDLTYEQQHYKQPYWQPPSHLLPELDELEDISSPSSPSLRTFSSLPSLSDPTSDLEIFSLSPPSSPSISLLSLPGADSEEDTPTLVDDEYPPFPSSSYGSHPSASSSSSSLLLLDDPNELPLSPTPDSLPLDLSWLTSIPESELDPDLHRLSALLFRSRSAEREARKMEGLMLEAGDPHRRAEARRERKVEKERSREVEALLRLKIEEMGLGSSSSSSGGGGGDGGPDEEEGSSEGGMEQKKPGPGAMRDLVARMVFRRRDSWRPLAQRQNPFMKSGSCRVRSPLASRVYREGDNDMDTDDEDEDEWFDRLSGFDSNSGSGSHWSSSSSLEMHDTDPTGFELKSHPGQSQWC